MFAVAHAPVQPRRCGTPHSTKVDSYTHPHNDVFVFMSRNQSNIPRQIEEIYLLKCSLLPGESIVFDPDSDDSEAWNTLLDLHAEGSDIAQAATPTSSARLQISTEDHSIWFDVELPLGYGGNGSLHVEVPVVSVRGDELGRAEQCEWQTFVRETLKELRDAE